MAGFRLLSRARADLLDIADFTADRWSDGQAERYLTLLFDGFHKLVELPELRRPYPEIPPYWRALVERHAVFYRVSADGDILIVRVLHVAMLPHLHLIEEEDER